jgi:two-component system, OmpR family, catabolic regulation response regulator CreB
VNRVLLLEDDPAIAATVVFALEREGFEVQHHLLCSQAQAAAALQRPDLAVLDMGLPDGLGMDLCRLWRSQDALRTLPVLMLTARADELDRVVALETGADDYLTKPFSPRELVARLRALLRRAAMAPTAAPVDTTPWFEHDPLGQRIHLAGQPLDLTRLEYGLLVALLRSAGRIRSRESLLDEVWGGLSDATDRTVDTHVKTLRAKLRACQPNIDAISTHRGMGYSLAVAPAAPPR